MRQAMPASQQYPMSSRGRRKGAICSPQTVRAAHERTKDTGLSHAAAVIERVLEEKLSNAHSYSATASTDSQVQMTSIKEQIDSIKGYRQQP